MNFGELKTSIANHIHRTDLTTQIPDFVIYAESVISGDPDQNMPNTLKGIRTRNQSIRASQVINSEFEDMPTDFLSMRDIQIESDPAQPLTYLTPNELTFKFPSSTTGKPQFYSIHGDEFQFKPVPSTDYTLSYTYFQKYAALSGDTDTNWLLTNHPMTYVYASLIAASAYTENDPMKWVLLYNSLAASINGTDNKGRYPSRLISKVSTATP